MQDITRRAALTGTAAVAAVAVVPTAASADDAYLVALYRRWRARCRQVDDYFKTTEADVSDEEFDALCAPLLDMEHEIATTPAQSIRGIAAKFRANWIDGGRPPTFLDEDLDHLWGQDHDQAYIASIYRDLERLVGEGRHDRATRHRRRRGAAVSGVTICGGSGRSDHEFLGTG